LYVFISDKIDLLAIQISHCLKREQGWLRSNLRNTSRSYFSVWEQRGKVSLHYEPRALGSLPPMIHSIRYIMLPCH